MTTNLIHVAADTGALHEVSGDRWLCPPKTKAAVRDVRLPPFLVDGLDRLLHAHPYDTVHHRLPVSRPTVHAPHLDG